MLSMRISFNKHTWHPNLACCWRCKSAALTIGSLALRYFITLRWWAATINPKNRAADRCSWGQSQQRQLLFHHVHEPSTHRKQLKVIYQTKIAQIIQFWTSRPLVTSCSARPYFSEHSFFPTAWPCLMRVYKLW